MREQCLERFRSIHIYRWKKLPRKLGKKHKMRENKIWKMRNYRIKGSSKITALSMNFD